MNCIQGRGFEDLQVESAELYAYSKEILEQVLERYEACCKFIVQECETMNIRCVCEEVLVEEVLESQEVIEIIEFEKVIIDRLDQIQCMVIYTPECIYVSPREIPEVENWTLGICYCEIPSQGAYLCTSIRYKEVLQYITIRECYESYMACAAYWGNIEQLIEKVESDLITKNYRVLKERRAEARRKLEQFKPIVERYEIFRNHFMSWDIIEGLEARLRKYKEVEDNTKVLYLSF